MAYQGFSLADVLANANQLRAQQQRSQLADLQINQAQREAGQSQAVDALTASNPDATLADYAKAGGLQGVKASTEVAAARSADLTQKYRALYTAADAVANSDDPIAAVTSNPLGQQVIQNYDTHHGPGSFAKLTPDQVKEQAAIVRDHALAGLVDPEKQFQAHQEMVLAHFKEGQQNLRTGAEISSRKDINVSTQAAEDRRAAASRAVTMRGQDLEAGRANKPQLVTVKNPDGTETQKWVMPGQTEGPALGPPSQKPMNESDKKNAVLFNSLQDAEAHIQKLTGAGGTDTSSKWNAFLGNAAMSRVGGNVAQSNSYKQYEAAAQRWAANLLYLKSGATATPAEIQSTWRQFFPQPGENADTIAQKNQARQEEIASIRSVMAPNAKPAMPVAGPSVAAHPASIQALLEKYK